MATCVAIEMQGHGQGQGRGQGQGWGKETVGKLLNFKGLNASIFVIFFLIGLQFREELIYSALEYPQMKYTLQVRQFI